ncbi:type II secretion system F family protein [Pseudoflavonifractor phocaeensis]|uniref:type II secretion system F family protein n=1 Tax=Pseudoflavonifractor phocaeensis TaxID=1870988 RepID=UPI001F23E4F8|nr:type II secretion system F family protein [Pseudoflavonifractor phocaeensis]MCF2661747.1 type II secretion system F family protein [Pseudoflavonifractor phocaeensis]
MKARRLSSDEISNLCRALSLLLHAGTSAGDALSLLADGEASPFLRALLDHMSRQTDAGGALSEAVRETGCFPDYVCGLLAVGERSGRTEEALNALADYYEERFRLDRRMRSLLLYPAVLLLVMLAVLVVLLTRVLPIFNDVYAGLGSQLTGLAGGLLALGRLLDRAMPLLCLLLALFVGLLALFAASPAFRETLSAWWRKRWGDRGVSQQLNTARFAQSLAMGLNSGLPLEESLSLSANLLEDVPAARQRCASCLARLEQGEPLTRAMTDSALLPQHECRLLELGLRSGNGDSAMSQIARRLSEDSESALNEAVSRVEPALVLVTSSLVGMVLLSVMLPLMNIMSAIG